MTLFSFGVHSHSFATHCSRPSHLFVPYFQGTLHHRQKKPTRHLMRHIPDASGDELVSFVCDVVSPGSTVQTDGWGGYNELQKNGYVHQKKIMSSSDEPAHVSMPGVNRIASLLKRWIL